VYHLGRLANTIRRLLHVNLSSLKPHGRYGLILDGLPRSTKKAEHIALIRSKMLTENRLRSINQTETQKTSREKRDDPKTTDFPPSSTQIVFNPKPQPNLASVAFLSCYCVCNQCHPPTM